MKLDKVLCFFGLDCAQNTIVVYCYLRNKPSLRSSLFRFQARVKGKSHECMGREKKEE